MPLPRKRHSPKHHILITWYGLLSGNRLTLRCLYDSSHNPMGFAGQYTDEESDLVYMRTRYYDPSTEQFISRDPAVGTSGQPYVYAAANPVNATDPSGQIIDTIADGIAVGTDIHDIEQEGLNWGNGLSLVADVGLAFVPFIPAGVGLAARSAKAAAHAEEGAARLYRVEGRLNERFTIDAAGNVSLKSDITSMLFVSFDAEHANYFLGKRVSQGLEGAHIKSFEVDSGFLSKLRADAVPQLEGPRFPGRPQLVDVTTCRECYGIPSEYFGDLQRAIIQGTGTIRWP